MADDLFYKHHVFTCQNERPEGHPRGSCGGQNTQMLANYMKVRAKELGISETRVNKAGCLDRCELGPIMVVYPEGVWYQYRDQADVDEILQTHFVEGRIVERLVVRKDQKPPQNKPK